MAPSEHPAPPVAPRRPHALEAHGHKRVDDWYWLGDPDDPEVLSYLRAENAYTQAVLSPTELLQAELFEGIRSKTAETDAGAPLRHGEWWYFNRSVAGRQYPVVCRLHDPARQFDAVGVTEGCRRGTSDAEEVLLDQNLLTTGEYLAVGVLDITPDHNLLAYGIDLDGSEMYNVHFRDLRSGEELPDVVEGAYYGSAWAADNRTFFYTRPDDAMRPYQVWRHEIGSRAEDSLVYQEDDERFFVGLSLSRDESRVVVHTSSMVTSEAMWIDATAPLTPPRVVLARSNGVEYDVEYDGDTWLVRTNRPADDGSPRTNFVVYRLPGDSSDPHDLEEILPHRDDVTIEGVDAFEGFLAVWERHQADGLARIRVLPKTVGSEVTVEQSEPVYKLSAEPNPEWSATSYRFGYTSLVTPFGVVEYDVAGNTTTTVWSQLVPSGHDPSRYRTERIWAPAPDGTLVPVSVVGRTDLPLDGSSPCLLYGYGAYETTIDPSFSVSRLNLIERGVNFAIAHVRGGGELGRRWYEGGRMESKVNSFTDFVAAADYLIATGWTDPGRLVARGGSAGGLLMGAVTNMRPDLWRAIIAEVPFVDVVTTMCNPDLPLTVIEWDEWGDPLHDREAFERMLSYSPYDNVEPGTHPAMYVTAGLNDPRVGYWEPAKWVAKMRSLGLGSPERPILLRTELGAGHGGVSGRYDAWKDEARVQAFILWQIGLAAVSDPLSS